MEANPLYRVDPPGKNRSPQQVAEELVHLIRTDFSYHTAALCDLFLCDRQWIDMTFRPVIRHIFITRYFREYIVAHVTLKPQEKDLLLHGFYFYSASDLKQYWRENAIAERKTVPIDLAEYQQGGFTAELTNEMEYHRSVYPNAKEKSRHMTRMEKLLTPEGYRLYLASFHRSKSWAGCPLPELRSDLPLTNLAQERTLHHLNSNALAMQHLLRKGATRIKIGSRALWIIPDTMRYRVPIAVPVEELSPTLDAIPLPGRTTEGSREKT